MLPSTAARDDDVAILVARVLPTPPPALPHRMPFDPKPESAGLTRGFTAGLLHGAGWGELADVAVLLASELTTNAVRHARGPYELIVTFRGQDVEIAVQDGDPRLPDIGQAGPLEDNGRGFILVNALAVDWGFRPLPDGKVTWFTLRAP